MIMDQGPVYALARLGQVEPPLAGTEAHEDWWTEMVDQWAEYLHAVIWLDAPNDVLRQRVSTRSQAHEIKDTSEATAMAFMNHYRASYEVVLSYLERPGGPLILRYDTSRLSPDDTASDAIEQLVRLDPRFGRPVSGGGSS